MPIHKVNASGICESASLLRTVYDEQSASLPDNLVGDRCDQATNQPVCSYWCEDGWSDSDMTQAPDPEDYGDPWLSASYSYVSCMFR